MSEKQKVESEKQKVPENQEKKNQEDIAYKESKEQEGDIDKDKGGFFSLCPSVLENNEEYKPYYEALDYAFQDADIKNIAITGIYGAGKSTVWKSYVKKRNLKNIVTITLGQYESPIDRELEIKSEGKTEGGKECKHNSELEQENRIERKLINQIISQISSERTPLSKYKIKLNKSDREIYRDTRYIILFLLSILFWLEKDWILGGLNESFKPLLLSIFSILEIESKAEFILQCLKHSSRLLYFIICLLLFITPVYYFLLRFVKENRFFIHKIHLKGVETIINEGNIDDETVLDKDIKEIIYLLTSAEVEILVIEDLDRFNNITIFTKLRELNYMLNKHLEVNHCARKVRFVYMLRDGILETKDRVKFFDFVLPILPYIHSKNSESILLSGMNDCGFKDNKHLIIKTSLYVGEMRILKNIVNEYRIYLNMLAMKKLQLSEEKLFALIVVKNLFPHDFDLLQVDQGSIYYAFNEGKETLKNIISDEIKDSVQDNSVNERSERLRRELKYVSTTSLKGLISRIKENQKVIDSLIFGNETLITTSPYIALLRFFINKGYLSEDYWLYISPFHEGDLSHNDVVFMKRLIEGQENIGTKIDNVEAVLRHLDEDDFMRKGILNEKLLKAILKQREEDYYYYWGDRHRVKIMMESICENGLYSDVILLLVTSNYDLVCRYIQSALYIGAYSHIENILNKTKELEEESGESYDEDDEMLDFIMEDDWIKLQKWIACSILTYDGIEAVKNLFESEELKNLIQTSISTEPMMPDGELDIFFENLKHANVQFTDLKFLQKDNITYVNTEDKDFDDGFIRDIAERIQRSNTYILNVDNIQILVNIILGKKANYAELLSEIYNNDALESTKEYIRDDFNNFIKEYINYSNPVQFKNSAEIVIEIINSDISEEDKIKYIENNDVPIPDINKLTIPLYGNIAKKLYLKNTISCSKENVNKCYAAIELSDVPEFVTYLNGEINTQNEEEILKDNSKLCEDLLKSEKTSEELFGFTIKYAKNPLDILTSNISEDKCFLLIESNLIKISKSNVRILVDSCFTESIDKWLELAKGDDQDNLVEFLCTENLDKIKDYIEMFLRHLQEKNAIKLIDKMKGEIKIQRIYLKRKRYPICARLSKYVLDTYPIIIENIRYICKEFKDFEYQQEFVDSLISHNQFQDLKDEDLNKDVMKYLLTYTLVSVENKVMLLQTKIQNKVEKSELKEYIQLIDEIKELNEVWNHKQPKLNSTYKRDIGKALADCGYVKIRNTSPISRIVLLDSQRQ